MEKANLIGLMATVVNLAVLAMACAVVFGAAGPRTVPAVAAALAIGFAMVTTSASMRSIASKARLCKGTAS